MKASPTSTSSSRVFRKRINSTTGAERGPLAWSPLFMLMLIIFPTILAIRKLYIARDDLNYLVYFSNEKNWLEQLLNSDDWWRTIIEEPLWNIYAISMGLTFGAEEAFRLTLFLGSFLFMYCTARISGNWPITVFCFVFSPALATQMYFNQVRQGVALSVFLLIALLLQRTRPQIKFGAASFAASLIHSSFLVTFLSSMSLALKPSLRIAGALGAVIVVFAISQSGGLSDLVDLGRRKGDYVESGFFNANYYLVTIGAYGSILFLLWMQRKQTHLSEWYHLLAILFILSIGLTLLYEQAGRLIYICESIMIVVLGQSSKTGNVRINFTIWAMYLLISDITAYFRDDTLDASVPAIYSMIFDL